MPHLTDFKPGDRVQLHPATDLWMQGARYGVVKRIGGRWIYVSLDIGLIKKILPMNLMPVPAWHRLGDKEPT